MAGKNQVTLTFAGDSSSLERTFEKVGASSKTMGTHTSSAIDKIGTASTRAGRTAKGLQGALGGLVSSGQGVRAMMDGDILGGLLMLEGGFGKTALSAAKLAKNIAATALEFVVSSAKMVASMATTVASTVAGWVVMGVQAMINAAKMAAAWLISLGPIGLVIAAVGAIIAILVALGVDFDDVKRIAGAAWDFILGAIQAAWNWVSEHWPLILAILTGPIGLAVLAITSHWETIKAGFTAVKDWIAARISDVVGFFTGLPGRLAGAAGNLWGFITSGFKSAINAVIGIWNGLKIPGFSFHQDMPGPIPDISFSWSGINLPDIPLLHSGGTFRAPAGQREGLAMLLDGERVTRPGQPAGVTVHVYVQGSIRSDRDLVKMIRDEFERGGLAGVLR